LLTSFHWRNLAPKSAAKNQIAEGLVFPLKAGNKPSKDG